MFWTALNFFTREPVENGKTFERLWHTPGWNYFTTIWLAKVMPLTNQIASLRVPRGFTLWFLSRRSWSNHFWSNHIALNKAEQSQPIVHQGIWLAEMFDWLRSLGQVNFGLKAPPQSSVGFGGKTLTSANKEKKSSISLDVDDFRAQWSNQMAWIYSPSGCMNFLEAVHTGKSRVKKATLQWRRHGLCRYLRRLWQQTLLLQTVTNMFWDFFPCFRIFVQKI